MQFLSDKADYNDDCFEDRLVSDKRSEHALQVYLDMTFVGLHRVYTLVEERIAGSLCVDCKNKLAKKFLSY